MTFCSHEAWISPGQWGREALLVGFLVLSGFTVASRSRRMDVSFGFLGFFGGALFVRALVLGDPLSIPLHQLESGALLIFSFFMISDPKTTPDSRKGRFVFAALVAALTYYFWFFRFDPKGMIYALVLLCPVVPILNRLFPGGQYRWDQQNQISSTFFGNRIFNQWRYGI